MRRMLLIALGVLAASTGGFAQAPAELEIALLAAPANLREGATVVKWKADFTYDTLRKGTNRLVCMDRSGQPGQPAFVSECTSIGNLERLAQNMKFETEPDRPRDRRRSTPLRRTAPASNPSTGQSGTTYRAPTVRGLEPHDHRGTGSHDPVNGLPDNPKMGGVWIMNAGTTTAHLMTPGE